jgi:hypothetical protein
MKPASEIIGRDSFAGYDIDFEDESGQVQQEAADSQYAATAAAAEENGGEAPRSDFRPENREGSGQRDNGSGQREFREPRQEWRRDRDNRDNREGGRQDARPPRDDRPPREDRPRNRDRDRDRDRDRPERNDPMPVVEPEATPLTAAAATAPAAAASEDFHLRSQDGDLSPAPAFLQPRADAGETAEPKRVRAPRRRRAPRGFEEGGAPANATEEA